MCNDNTTCDHPEKLKGKPGECSPKQIEECHGIEILYYSPNCFKN